jgi:hypothetical protein
MRPNAFTAIIAMTLVCSGCQSAAPTTKNYSYLRMPSCSREAAFTAARQAMGERYRIARGDLGEGVITSVPEESDEPGSSGQVGDVVGAPRRLRTTAQTRVSGSGNSAEVWCKVLVERYETDERNLFVRDLAMADAPTHTPAERDAGATPEQNAVWRTDRRDKVAERDILRAVHEIVERGGLASPRGGP